MRKFPMFISPCLVATLCLFSAIASATHSSNENYDGSVDSFRWLKRPLDVAEVTIRNDRGEQVPMSGFAGKIVLLNLWASWCKPCVKELPALDRLQQRLGGSDFVVVAVTLDEVVALAQQFYVDLSIDAMAMYHESADHMGRHFPVDVLPATFILDRQGQAMGMLRSSIDWDDARTDTLIERLIAGVNAATLRAEKSQRRQSR